MRLNTFRKRNSKDCCEKCWSGFGPGDLGNLQMVQITPNGKMHLWKASTRTRCGLWLVPFDEWKAPIQIPRW